MTQSASTSCSTCLIELRIDADRMDQALDVLRSATGPIGAKHGCLRCSVSRDQQADDRLYYVEEWRTEEALRRHLSSPDLWPVLVAMDMCCEAPLVRIGVLTVQSGMELLYADRRILGAEMGVDKRSVTELTEEPSDP